MKNHAKRNLVFLTAIAVAGALVPAPGCTVKKERAPGPLVAWFFAAPEAEHYYRLLAQDFTKETGVPVQLVFKESYEIRNTIHHHSDEIVGAVDMIEVDLFDLEDAAPVMTDLRPLLRDLVNTQKFAGGAVAAGEFQGRVNFMPWRLSWPAMIVSSKAGRPPDTWPGLARAAERNPGELIIPGLDDQEMFSFLYSLAWSFEADPSKPYDEDLVLAFDYLADLSKYLRIESGGVRSSDVAARPWEQRPLIFFVWPEGMIPMILDGSLQLGWRAEPLPCGGGSRCGVFALGRYLGVPRNAPHTEEAARFILFMISPAVQRQMVFFSPWLPIRTDGFGDLGPRQSGYHAFAQRTANIKTPPRDLSKIQEALLTAGRMVLYQGSSGYGAVKKYREIMAEE